MKKCAMSILIVTALAAAVTASARPCGYYYGPYGRYGCYRGYYGTYGYYYGSPLVNGVASLVGASLNLAADIVTAPFRGGVYYSAPPAVCPAPAPVVCAPPVPAVCAPPTPVVYTQPSTVVYTQPTVTYAPAPVVYAPAAYVVR